MKNLLILLSLFSLSINISAQDDSFYQALLQHFKEKTPLDVPFKGSMAEAMAIQDRFVEELQKDWGPVVGYKAALTTKGLQKRFGVGEPLRGTLLEKMIVPSGSTLSTKTGAHTFFEGDLMFRVGDGEAMMRAQGGEEIYQALDAVIPFVEVPDLVYGNGMPLTGASVTAINTGARMGVVGEPIPIPTEYNFKMLKDLKKIRIELLDEQEDIIGFGYALTILEHPINAVLFVRDSLKKQGRMLKTGDLISLGAMTNMTPVNREGTLTARYFNIFSDKHHDVVIHFKNP